MGKNRYLRILFFGIFFVVIGFIANKPMIALTMGGIPIVLFIVFTMSDLKKENSEKSQTANTTPTTNKPFSTQYKLETPTKKYYANQKRSNTYVAIGSYYYGHRLYANAVLIRKDAKWFVQCSVWEPVNEGLYEQELNSEFFEKYSIESVEQFLKHFVKGQIEPCIDLALKEEDLISLLNKIIQTKGLYIPEGEPQVDETHICYKFQQDYTAHNERLKTQTHKYPLIAVSELLLDNGFVFCHASAGGGIDEISHTGDKSYSAEYIDFVDFRDNFESDMDEAEESATEHSGGWISSLNYGIINVYLKQKELRVNISVEGNTVRVHWYDITEKDNPIFTQVNEKVLEVLGRDVKQTQETCYKYIFSDEFEKDYLSNWDIHHKIKYS